MPVLKDTEDHLVRNVRRATHGPAPDFTWARVRGVTAMATPAVVTLKPADVCNASITLLGQDVTAVRQVIMEIHQVVAVRPVSPAHVLELAPITNSLQLVVWSLTGSQPVTTVPLDSPADAVKDVPQDIPAILYLDRVAQLTTILTVIATIATKAEAMDVIVVCATAR